MERVTWPVQKITWQLMYAKHEIDVKKDVESSLCDWFVWSRGSLQVCLRSQCGDESVRNKKFEKVFGFRWVI